MNKISFSELKTWNECSYKHKLSYIDELKLFNGNLYTAFGTAVHTTAEELVLLNITEDECKEFFVDSFKKELDLLEKKLDDKDQKLFDSMVEAGQIIVPGILQSLKDKFGNYEVFSSEELLFESIEEKEDFNFKGYIDLVIKTGDGKYHILDWKTCSWGWNAKKRSDPMTTYQLIYYKNFFASKHNIDKKDIKTYFGLLKRTSKKDNIEIFEITSGAKRISNSLKVLNNVITNIENGVAIKNRLSCKYCEYDNTEYCIK
jgi:ATP-dependent exoDNAse (exonuclease V) beta subunit